jgi:hypothetical protein
MNAAPEPAVRRGKRPLLVVAYAAVLLLAGACEPWKDIWYEPVWGVQVEDGWAFAVDPRDGYAVAPPAGVAHTATLLNESTLHATAYASLALRPFAFLRHPERQQWPGEIKWTRMAPEPTPYLAASVGHTFTAEVAIVAEVQTGDQVRELEQIDVVQVGPSLIQGRSVLVCVNSGMPVTIGEVGGHHCPQAERRTTPVGSGVQFLDWVSYQFTIDDDVDYYRLHFRVRHCQQSGGLGGCVAESKVVAFDASGWVPTPPATPAPEGTGAAGAAGETPPTTLEAADPAGGLARLDLQGGRDPGAPAESSDLPGDADLLRTVAGVPVSRSVFALYRTGDDLGRVAFRGVELAAPLPADTVTRSAYDIADGALRITGQVNDRHQPTAPGLRSYDPGPHGGQVWCQTFDVHLLPELPPIGTSYACAWVDRWTVGVVTVSTHAVEELDLDEAGAAALLVAMRADIQIAP